MKYQPSKYQKAKAFVTLYVRVWIEMMINISFSAVVVVTLYVRVWIEMSGSVSNVDTSWCHPLREGVD